MNEQLKALKAKVFSLYYGQRLLTWSGSVSVHIVDPSDIKDAEFGEGDISCYLSLRSINSLTALPVTVLENNKPVTYSIKQLVTLGVIKVEERE
ncbi:MAG: hypothetical protein P4L31_07295 [Candidatus Babeliales bacterium]|nr:hypothetical protein [Candidatus Babeliales bacterium]